jgi:DNA-binding GntR family transcriptional regulator
MEDDLRLARSIREHKAILEAMVSGNAELAKELIEKHIANAKECMIARFDYHG